MKKYLSFLLVVLLLPTTVLPALAKPPFEALWQDAEGDVVIASGPCQKGSAKLCGIILGIHLPDLSPYAKNLCGLPIFWDFTAEEGGWRGGFLLDPQTGTKYRSTLTRTAKELTFHLENGVDYRFSKSSTNPEGFKGLSK